MPQNLKNIKHLDSGNFFLIAGPCVVESEDMVFEIANHINNLSDQYKIPYIFKASYRKANRSRGDSYQGPGDAHALDILTKVRHELNIPVLTDIHSAPEAALAAASADVLQIPAFLCRQTDILLAAAKTTRHINIKKGQFLSPSAMAHAVKKVKDGGNDNVWLTERGTTFGYSDLVVDYRGIPQMQEIGVPVVLDVTHSLQQPNQASGVTGGQPEMIETIAKAGIAAGADGIFLETHPNPAEALSDGANMLQMDHLEGLLEKLVRIREAIK